MVTEEMYMNGMRCRGICTSNCKNKNDCYQYSKVVKNVKNDIEIKIFNHKTNKVVYKTLSKLEADLLLNNKELTLIDALLAGDTSGAIERSEKREQQLTVENQRLPLKSNDHFVPREIRDQGITEDMEWEEKLNIERENNKKWTKEQYEKMGIKIINENDNLFFNVTLPDGWKVKPTDHSMWNEVIDNNDRRRISFFYKGAFYDRKAFSNFEKRYTYSEMPFDYYKTDATYEERKSKEWYGIVYDCGKEIFRTKSIVNKDYFDKSLNRQCIEYLKENYPNWQDINAYWND